MKPPVPNEDLVGKSGDNAAEQVLTESEIATAREAALSGNAKELLCMWGGVLLTLGVIAAAPALVGNRIDRFWGPFLGMAFENGENPLYSLLLAFFFGSCAIIVIIAVSTVIVVAWDWAAGMRLTDDGQQPVAFRYHEEDGCITLRKWSLFAPKPFRRWVYLIVTSYWIIYWVAKAIEGGMPASGVLGILLCTGCTIRLHASMNSARFKRRTMKPSQMIIFERAVIIGTSLIKARDVKCCIAGTPPSFSIRINMRSCLLSIPIPDWSLETLPDWCQDVPTNGR